MAPRPTAERPPSGLDSHWTHTWDCALEVMREQGSWSWELKPLLDEYVQALKAAQAAREDGEDTRWDRHAKRAAGLADQLALTPRGRKAAGLVGTDEAEEDPLERFAASDELASRRRAS